MDLLRRCLVLALLLIASSRFLPAQGTEGGAVEWPSYGGDAGGSRYSPLTEINRGNVSQLKPTWEYHTGDLPGANGEPKTAFETTPIVAFGTMYLSTPFNRIVALDPESGKERWVFDPRIDLRTPYPETLINRGVTLWTDVGRNEESPCYHRIFIATIDARLFAVDAATGRSCSEFGKGGQIDLTKGIPNIRRRGEYQETSAPAVIDDLIVVGSSVADNDRVDSPSGVVRAFRARTGALQWSWNPIPENIGPTGAGNAWSTISVDAERGLVFVPTGSASPDYHGHKRPGENRWANSVVALSAKSGELVWGFQLVHHDLWDYDTAPQPVLATLHRGGAETPVVIQGSKTGNLFVFNRETGQPVFGVEERPVPQSDAQDEETWPTQPFP